MLKSERNFQIQLAALLVNIFLMIYFKLPTMETAIILMVCFSVLAAEVFNTAAEKICDFIHPDYDESIGFIKDICAGAVLLSTIASVVVGILIYWKYFF